MAATWLQLVCDKNCLRRTTTFSVAFAGGLWQTELLVMRSPAAVDRAMSILLSHWSDQLHPLLSLARTILPAAGWQNNYHGNSDDTRLTVGQISVRRTCDLRRRTDPCEPDIGDAREGVKLNPDKNMAESLNSLDSSLEGEHHSFPLALQTTQTMCMPRIIIHLTYGSWRSSFLVFGLPSQIFLIQAAASSWRQDTSGNNFSSKYFSRPWPFSHWQYGKCIRQKSL